MIGSIIEQPSTPALDLLAQGFEHDFAIWSQQQGGRTLGGYHSKVPDSKQLQICWLHGNGFNSLAYAPILSDLAKPGAGHPGYSVFATDIPGHGLSHPPERQWPHWRSLAKAVDQAMAKQFVSQPVQRRIGVGHSLGGIVTLLQAHQNPQRFEKILLLDPMLLPPSLILAQQSLQTFKLWPWAPLPKAARRRRRHWESSAAMRQQLGAKRFYRRWHCDAFSGYVAGGHRSVAAGVELSCAPEWEAKIFASYPTRLLQALQEVKIPVHIICALDSFPFLLKGAKRAAALNPNISYQQWGAGHCFPMEQPLQTAVLIRGLLQEPG
ncbi:MAG: alpha/beta hydrolase [Motiliproteus sp.]